MGITILSAVLAFAIIVAIELIPSQRRIAPASPVLSPPVDTIATVIIFPAEVYQETSQVLSITVPEELLSPSMKNSTAKLEVELLAAGVTVSGDQRQTAALARPPLHFEWNCYFKDSGEFVAALVYTLVSSDGSRQFLTATQHRVRVNRIDHLTQRQLWIWAGILGIPSGFFALVKLLQEIGLIRKKTSDKVPV